MRASGRSPARRENATASEVAGGRSRGHRLHDAVVLGAGAAILGVSALPVSEHRISGAETSIFHVINGAPGLVYAPVWVLMQLGNVAVVPGAVVVALLARLWRLAAGLAVAGVVTYVLAKVIKQLVPRGRPATLLDDVEIRGAAASGLGFVSGHAGVAVSLVTVAFPYLSVRLRVVAAVLAATVCLGRVYVGAHLPLDVVGGAALGLVVGAAVKVVAPTRRQEVTR